MIRPIPADLDSHENSGVPFQLLNFPSTDNGRMSLEEFLRLVGNRGLQTETEIHHDLEDALRFFDKGGRGLLRTDDLRTALKSYGEPLDDDDLTEMMKMADVRGDGCINCLGQSITDC